jgi:DNA-binding NarL/FixJ family response regulator
MKAAPRVLVAEADTPTRTGVRLALTRCGFEIAAEARDAVGAVMAAVREQPDLALLAADLPGDGVSAARSIAERLPATQVVVLTAREHGDELIAAVLAGASGYLGKDMSPARLPQALEGILAGEAAIPRRLTRHVLEALRGRDARRARFTAQTRRAITDRQWEILNLLAEGRSTAEMARWLGISEVTARRHISALLPRLGLTDRAGAVELMRDRSRE